MRFTYGDMKLLNNSTDDIIFRNIMKKATGTAFAILLDHWFKRFEYEHRN